MSKHQEIRIYDLEEKIYSLNVEISNLKKENDKLTKQLSICEVSRSLPIEKEKTLELINQLEKRDFENQTSYAKNFIFGFNTCYSWLKNKQI